MSERGSVTVLMLAVTALLCVMLVALSSLGGLLAARTQAGTAADAAALAAAVATYPDLGRGSPYAAARRVAVENGAILVDCLCPVLASLERRVVTVTVRIEVEIPMFGQVAVRKVSRAEFDPVGWLGR